MWDYWAFLVSRLKGRMCCLDRKERNIMFDNILELVYMTLYIVYDS